MENSEFVMEKGNKCFSDEKKVLTKIGNYTSTGKTLGKGHFAQVIEAYHTLLKVKVAIKIINKIEISDMYVKKNLKRETKIMSKISHPNIIYIFETIETTQHYYIITELGSGGDLCNFVKSQRYGKLDERRARPLAKQLVSAVGHLHERGIVHRDLKMENILLDNSKEKIKIVDFGLSNFCQLNELLKTHCGSPEYAAPELYIKGRKYGPEVDIWSLGIIFYGMLVGRLPFQTIYKSGINPNDRKKNLMNETKNGLTIKHHKHMMDLSYLIRNLITKMLKPDANERISMHELQVHAWVYGSGNIHEFPVEDRNWRKKIITKISDYYGMKYSETYNRILNLPYGPLGGIYNIEKYTNLSEKLNEYYLKCETIKSKISSTPLTSTSPIYSRSATPTHIYSNNSNKPSPIMKKEHHHFMIPNITTTEYKKFSNDYNLQHQQKNIDKIKMEYLNCIKTNTNNNNSNNYKFSTLINKTSPIIKPTNHIKYNTNNQQQSNKILSTKPNKSASIKMINYLNTKISQALGIYSSRKNRKITAEIETNEEGTTTKGSAGHLQLLTLNNNMKISDKEIIENQQQQNNDKNYKIKKYQNEKDDYNQKYSITKNLIKQHQNIQLNDNDNDNNYEKLKQGNLPCKIILDKNKVNHQKYLIKPKLFRGIATSNSNRNIINNTKYNNYYKNSTIPQLTSILPRNNNLNRLSSSTGLKITTNTDFNSRKDVGAIRKGFRQHLIKAI